VVEIETERERVLQRKKRGTIITDSERVREVKHCRLVVESSTHCSRVGGLPEIAGTESRQRQPFHRAHHTIEPFCEHITPLTPLHIRRKVFLPPKPLFCSKMFWNRVAESWTSLGLFFMTLNIKVVAFHLFNSKVTYFGGKGYWCGLNALLPLHVVLCDAGGLFDMYGRVGVQNGQQTWWICWLHWGEEGVLIWTNVLIFLQF